MQLEIIQQKIYEVRRQKVILDFVLAALFEVETKRLKKLSEEISIVFRVTLCLNLQEMKIIF